MVHRNVLGKEHDFKELKVDILKLKYYPENPRVHHVIHGLGKNPSQENIEKTMWKNDNTKDLYWDIKKSGLLDPILISEDFFVMEGNTRLCAFRYLYNHAKERKDEAGMKKWRTIRCEMYPPGLDKLGMHVMLGKWHIKQKTEWDAFEKASYIKRLMVEFNKTEEEIAEEMHLKKPDIQKMLWVEKIMLDEKVTNIKQYSHIEQCYQKPALRTKMNQDQKFKKRFVGLIKSGNMGPAQNIRKVPAIMEKKQNGLDLLEKGVDFDTVYAKALEENPNDHPILKHMVKITKHVDKLQTLEFLKEIKKDKDKQNLVLSFIKSAHILEKILKKNNIK